MTFSEAQTLRDVLLLINMRVPIRVIRLWNRAVENRVEKFASACIAKAGDWHHVRLPAMPRVLIPYRTKLDLSKVNRCKVF